MKPAKTQEDRNMNFDGMESVAPKHSNKYAHNQWSGHSNDGRLVNYPGQQRDGAVARDPAVRNTGPSVTKDRHRRAPDKVGSGRLTYPSNPDSLNYGRQERNPGGTRTWDPSAGQNYRGNPDSIRAEQSGGPGYGATSRGSRPVAPGKVDGINYGPKKQY